MKKIPTTFAEASTFEVVLVGSDSNQAQHQAHHGDAAAVQSPQPQRRRDQACPPAHNVAISSKPALPCGIKPPLPAKSERRKNRFERNAELYFDSHWGVAVARTGRKGVRDFPLTASKAMDAVLRKFKPSKGRFEHFFRKVLRRRIASALRSQFTRERREVPLADGFDVTFASPQPLKAGEELASAVRKALAKLRPRERKLFILRFWHGYTCVELAKQEKRTPSTIANRFSRAFKKMRPTLAPFALRTVSSRSKKRATDSSARRSITLNANHRKKSKIQSQQAVSPPHANETPRRRNIPPAWAAFAPEAACPAEKNEMLFTTDAKEAVKRSTAMKNIKNQK